MSNKRVKVNDSYEIVRGLEQRGYAPNSQKGGFSNLCGNNANNLTPPPKNYGSKTVNKKIK